MADEAKRARDEESNIIKMPKPNHWEMINPIIFKHTGRAVNYDCTWNGEIQLGETVGCWSARPFNRPGIVSKVMEKVFLEMKEAGEIPWPEKCFRFTHEKGKEAAQRYMELVVTGKIKANQKSWGPNLERPRPTDAGSPNKEDDKSRFFLMVPEELAINHGFDTRDDGKYEFDPIVPGEQNRVIVTYAELVEKYPDLYEKPSGYINKAKKNEMIDAAIDSIKTAKGEDHEPTYMELATESTLKLEDVKKLMEERKGVTEEQEPAVYEEPSIDLSDVDETLVDLVDAESELLENTIGVPVEEVDEEEFVPAIAVVEMDPEGNEIATAMVTVTEEPIIHATNVDGMYEQHHVEHMQMIPVRMYDNATVTKVNTESVAFDKDGGGEEQHYLCYLPGLDVERFVPKGLNLLGDAESGKCYLYNVVVGPADEELDKKAEEIAGQVDQQLQDDLEKIEVEGEQQS